jgi:methylated-DNA-[protein]-cysteine S-methyltransferase
MLAKPQRGRYARAMSLCYVETPIGRLALEADGDRLVGTWWASPGERASKANRAKPGPVLREAARQVHRYFRGKLRRFDLPLEMRGSDHQRRVWKMMQDIPWGGTATYGGIAAALGSGPRAVGTACGRNPIPVIVPCHRVLGSGGSIGGYSGGRVLATKRDLLALEGVVVA